jgi:hypothetical protein
MYNENIRGIQSQGESPIGKAGEIWNVYAQHSIVQT